MLGISRLYLVIEGYISRKREKRTRKYEARQADKQCSWLLDSYTARRMDGRWMDGWMDHSFCLLAHLLFPLSKSISTINQFEGCVCLSISQLSIVLLTLLVSRFKLSLSISLYLSLSLPDRQVELAVQGLSWLQKCTIQLASSRSLFLSSSCRLSSVQKCHLCRRRHFQRAIKRPKHP